MNRIVRRVCDHWKRVDRKAGLGILGSGALMMLAVLPAKTMQFGSQELAALIGLGLLLVGYALMAYVTNSRLRYRQQDGIFAPLLYVMTSAMLIGVFAFYYARFPWAGPAAQQGWTIGNLTDSLYFSAATFTTLGFGDMVPKSDLGKWSVIVESILGTMHSVFFILVFLRNASADVGSHRQSPV